MNLKDLEIRSERRIETTHDFEQVLSRISFINSVLDFHWRQRHEPFFDRVAQTGEARQAGRMLWVEFQRPDIHTGEIGWGRGRDEIVRLGAYNGSVVKTAYVLFRFILEHEAMEGFEYEGIRVFNPHHTMPELQLPAQIAAAKNQNEAAQADVRNSVVRVDDRPSEGS